MRLKPISPKNKGCLHAGREARTLKMNALLSVGFGAVTISRNGKTIWSGDGFKQFAPVHKDLKKDWTAQRAENMARKKRGDWRIGFDAPLNNSVFQRQGMNKWVLVAQGMGFA